ncbi:MAG: class I adenylate-forming enzyme family protein [Maricaulaceae bacterium]|jgi:acyl-CoA synthetase (AMP-forming)/AMP-acid ligase II
MTNSAADAAPDPVAMLEQPFGSISALIAAHAALRPDGRALADETRTMSYGELDREMSAIAASLARDGVKPGEAIAVCGRNSALYGAIYLGALRAGVVVAPMPTSATPDQLAGMIADCGAKIIFLDAEIAVALDGHSASSDVPRIALDGSGGDKIGGRAYLDWRMDPDEAAGFVPPERAPSDPFNIIYSSGTTGAPKGIVQSWGMRWAHMQRARLNKHDETAVTIVSTPLCSNTTLVSFFPTLAAGGAVVSMRKFDARGFLELAARERATHAMLVPVQYRRIMDVPDFNDFDLSSFRLKACTSAPFAAALKADIVKRWPGDLIEIYGMTEGGGACVLFAHEHPDKLHTVGQPGEGHDIRLIGEDGKEVAQGELGEVVGRSGAIMNGYHGLPEKTRETEWHDAEGARFIRTGDVGRFDEDGFLILMDRKKDMIISGGFNVYPSDLEAELAKHEAVAEAAVVGAPSEEWGETPVAFVALKPGAKTDGEELRAWVNARLGKIQRLQEVKIVDALPRSSIGKVLKRELKDQLA